MSHVACITPICYVVFILEFYREKYYTGLINDPELHVKLTGSWETTVGPELDTFCASPKTSPSLRRLAGVPDIC